MNDVPTEETITLALATALGERDFHTFHTLASKLAQTPWQMGHNVNPHGVVRRILISMGDTERSSPCPELVQGFPYARLMTDCITDAEQAFHDLPAKTFVHVLESLVCDLLKCTDGFDTGRLLNHIADLTFYNAKLAIVHLPEIWRAVDLRKEVETRIRGGTRANAKPSARLSTLWTITRNFLCTSMMQDWQRIGDRKSVV